jgi:CheY-like chemotaxis protein
MPANTVLIVEDDPAARADVATLLEASGFHPVGVEDGSDALDLLHEGLSPSLILLDMVLPRMDGWQFFARRQLDPTLSDIPVLVMTGVDFATKEWAVAMGGADLLAKPIDPTKLLDLVRRYANGVAP